jgi:hypothetical protein
MASLRDTAACIGITGDFSVVGDFFGYLAPPQDLSVLTQINRLQGRYVDMNLIRVGIESFTSGDETEIDGAVQFTRDTYAQVSLGVGRVLRFFITTADANGRDNIGSDGEAEDLTNEWTVDNDAMDIFFVLTYATSTLGLSPVDGPCNKDAKGMDGSVVAIEGSASTTGLTIAHEAGHYLGLEHVGSSRNLMFPSAPNGGNLTASQGTDMRDHCFTNDAC